MAKNFGQKFLALQIGMLILGILMFISGYALKKSIMEKRPTEVAEFSEMSESPAESAVQQR